MEASMVLNHMDNEGSWERETLDGMHVVVVGLGISGYWTCKWLIAQGALVTVSESKGLTELDSRMVQELKGMGVKLEAGSHRKESFLNADMIVISPGVPHDMDLLEKARSKGVHVTGELELAARFMDEPIVAITGTNGKTTVAALLGHVLEEAGVKVFVGGNIGTPLMAYLTSGSRADYIVAEVSSFQLDSIDKFCPMVSVLLNVSPDHLDRYPDYEAYVKSKMRIFQNQGPGQYAVVNLDRVPMDLLQIPKGVQVLAYGLEMQEGRHAWLEKGRIRSQLPDGEAQDLRIDAWMPPGLHNLENLMAVVLVARVLGLSVDQIEKGITGFAGLPHRLERVGELKGIMFYDDSKATNVASAARAIQSFDCPVVLIAGGRDKGASYGPLVEASKGRVRRLVLIGEAAPKLAEAFDGAVPYERAADMEEAVGKAFSAAQPRDVVLLSPACSSFDMFSNYEQRGEAFQKAVRDLIHGQGEGK
ncbi:MAG: UDP-N-acetylmuramoyl-L-alanine--D-glutamate ligase [Deltaproteobacteria bacterium]|nr:UDP-N-acetylmuramoyl-L-alanine--D-glutamate ligase [Deltaproteobacteria bacterium]MBW1929802.1 UDP-N-acetylmuramoyl-L-alanine--D-glutamate ligase [Deltaproteobacteria bacterium]MBW2024448.1 UDP-N-acetylmuramoyl-L-alanine--D-glutamate ligase [Deltaproteobacteria bacterium]MBW2124550.1 UDP-N-acetylmuramoyl-L-alanine--D-glutamate ligase [Deltaproteobacteria bacterium]RLB22477.1 MAG: UDP-N-acetylmuramoyl-L-alanine--D-glutamate ligase [Deltaproteobacteria bacterium]